MAKVLQIKLFASQNGISTLETEINQFLSDENLLTEDFLDLKYFGMFCTKGQGTELRSIVLIYRKELP